LKEQFCKYLELHFHSRTIQWKYLYRWTSSTAFRVNTFICKIFLRIKSWLFSEFYEEVYTEIEDKVSFILNEINCLLSSLPVDKLFFKIVLIFYPKILSIIAGLNQHHIHLVLHGKKKKKPNMYNISFKIIYIYIYQSHFCRRISTLCMFKKKSKVDR
jgi:hypothetical protein